MKLLSASTLVFALIPLSALAQGSAFWGLDMPSHGRGQIPAVHIVKEAEVLVANLTVVATKRDPLEQAADFTAGLQALRHAVAKQPALAIKDERSVLGGGEPNSLYASFSSGRLDTNRSASDLKIFHPLGADIDSLAAANMLRQLVGSLKLPRDVSIRIDSFELQVKDPDGLRPQLLEAIAADAAKLQAVFKLLGVQISGLENRVEQRPLNNRQVVVFLPYTLGFNAANR